MVAIISGLLGTVIGAFTGGFVAASQCDGGVECLGVAVVGAVLGAIFMESAVMSLSVHKANQRRGNLYATFIITFFFAVPIPFTMALGAAAIHAVPLFLLQVWVCVKVQLASGPRKAAQRKR